MYDVITVADEILRISKSKSKSLTPLQLMKIAYIAHGFYLALSNGKKDLFSNRIEAWKFGPVMPDLYHATKHFGRNPIPLSQIQEKGKVEDKDTLEFLEDVFNKYGHLSGYALSSLTHQAGTPWEKVFNENEFGTEIPDELILEHYKSKLNEQAGSPATT